MDENDRKLLVMLTSDIVTAYVGHNNVMPEKVTTLIGRVHAKLVLLLSQPSFSVASAPAVSISASAGPDHVTCLECGKNLKSLKRHLRTGHNLTVEEYRARWGLSSDHALVASVYAEERAALARKIGLGRKISKTPKSVVNDE